MDTMIQLAFLPALGLWLAALLNAVCAVRRIRKGRLSTVFWLSFTWPVNGYPDAFIDETGLRCWRRCRRYMFLFLGYCVCLAVFLGVMAGGLNTARP